MPTALRPQTQLTLRFADRVVPPQYGFPMKLRVPTKLGFKNPKHIVALFVTNQYPGGYWEDQGYNRFSGSRSIRDGRHGRGESVRVELLIGKLAVRREILVRRLHHRGCAAGVNLMTG